MKHVVTEEECAAAYRAAIALGAVRGYSDWVGGALETHPDCSEECAAAARVYYRLRRERYAALMGSVLRELNR